METGLSNEEKRLNVKKDYDLIADDYGNEFGTFIEDIDIYEKFVSFLPNGAHVLDLGAGSGRTYKYLNNKGFKYTGLDFSKKMMEKAFSIHGKFDYICDDMVNVKNYFEANSLDGVLAIYSLFHLPFYDFEKVIGYVYDLLKENGVFVFSYQIGNGEEFCDEPYLGDKGKNVLYMNYLKDEDVHNILDNLGFEILTRSEKIETSESAINADNNKTVFLIVRK